MFWVLQKNLYNEVAFEELLSQLQKQETPFEIVNIIPFAHTMIPDINVTGPVYVCGATTMGEIAKTKGWIPGYIDENLDYRLFVKHYGNYLVNANCEVAKFSEVKKKWDTFFIRPITDRKQFGGLVMNWEHFTTWQKKVIELNGESSHTTLKGDDLIITAPVTKIYTEYRFFVVNGEVITGSQYKVGTRVVYTNQFDERVTDFAKKMVNIWQPNKAFALDIAEIEDGLRVLEINSLNSAGFYACDMGKFVNAVNKL
jgi:hypothetical protein